MIPSRKEVKWKDDKFWATGKSVCEDESKQRRQQNLFLKKGHVPSGNISHVGWVPLVQRFMTKAFSFFS